MRERLCSLVRPTRAVIFDVDGTLITDTVHRDKHNFILSHVVYRPDIALSVEEWNNLRGLPDEGAYRYLVAKAAGYTFALDTALPEATYLALARDYVNKHIHDIAVRPGIGEVLSVVERCGLVRGIATNADWLETERKLAHTGLAKYFHFFVCLDGILAPKPAPDLYLQGIRLARAIIGSELTAEQVLAIEDTYIGAIAAQRAGCRVIVCPQNGGHTSTDPVSTTRDNVRVTQDIRDICKYVCLR